MASANARGSDDEGIDRLWRILLITGAVAGLLFLGIQSADYISDAKHPAVQRNDLISAAASLALLVIVGVIAARRAQIKRPSNPVPASGSVQAKATSKAKPAKRGASPARRKRRT